MSNRDGSSIPPEATATLLTINGGSSSLKFALFERGETLVRLGSGKVDRVGLSGSRLVVSDGAGRIKSSRAVEAQNLAAAVGPVMEWLQGRVALSSIQAIGHRVVHGGALHETTRVTAKVLDALREVSPLDPDHVPGEIALIEAFGAKLPDAVQVICFDTAFHHNLPRVAQIVPIPRRYEAQGVRRYGFHGISYAYLMARLAEVAGPEAAMGKVILAHLGSGASLAAVDQGQPVETTMGFTPTSGLVMSTRSGDLDPGVAGYLARTEGMTPDAFQRMVTQESGLLGVSETSPDLRDLLDQEAEDGRAAEAVELFCYRVRTAIGSLAAALGGVETLVFSGGIGEHAAEIRGRIVAKLRFLGIVLDDASNAAHASLISGAGSEVRVHVIPTDEEQQIARETDATLRRPG